MLTSFQKKMITSVIILLWLGSIQGSVAPTGELGYTLEKYDRSPGIYFESSGQVNLYNTEWKVVVYVDLNGIDTQSDEIEKYIKTSTSYVLRYPSRIGPIATTSQKLPGIN